MESRVVGHDCFRVCLRGGCGRPRDFEAALRGRSRSLSGRSNLGLIAEFKPRSPSRGAIRPGASPEAMAAVYSRYASAISVLCDGPFFGGGLDQLARVRASAPQPVLGSPVA